VVALLALVAIGAVALAVSIGRVRLPRSLVAAVGGTTYPLYLLHENIGFMIFNKTAGLASNEALVAAVAVCAIVASWAVWRFIDKPGQRFTKTVLNRFKEMIDARPRGLWPAKVPT
jgi:peptidoglycan/LPS O-acetylase OafA/YrhL